MTRFREKDCVDPTRTASFASTMRGVLIRVSLLLAAATCSAADFKPKGEHVVLCVWDGMRPDFIKPEITPTLDALARSGTFFANNHSFFVTTTEVNGTVLATGAFPRRSGIVGNREYRPSINLVKPVDTQGVHTIRVGDALENGHYINALTVAEIVQKAGHRTAVAATKPVGLLHDRLMDRSNTNRSVVLFAGRTYPSTFLTTITAALGKFPDTPPTAVTLDETRPNTAQNAWTTRALTDVLWGNGVPKYSLLWLGDPDFSQHLTAPGHPTAIAAIRNSDTNLASVLQALENKGVRAKTNIIVASDHGFSTIARPVDVIAVLKKAGIAAVKEFKVAPNADEALVINVGGSTSIYVIGSSRATVQKVVDVIQNADFAGPIFTREGLPGTFPLSHGRFDTAAAPDIVFPFRAIPGLNKYGVSGLIYGEARRPGGGTHGTLGKADINNTLVAAGPDIRAGFRSELPSGNIDVAPTILHLLGLPPPTPLDGRVLHEALQGDQPVPQPAAIQWLKAERKLADKTWRQWIQTSTYAGAVYFDQGDAAAE
jgi:arylsulfatase A-like enzyme